MTQRDLFKVSAEEQFLAFHAKHPKVYKHLVHLARSARGRGWKQVGIGMLWEVLRWDFALDTDEEFKLNNNYRSRYARLIMEQEADLRGVFDIRELRS